MTEQRVRRGSLGEELLLCLARFGPMQQPTLAHRAGRWSIESHVQQLRQRGLLERRTQDGTLRNEVRISPAGLRAIRRTRDEERRALAAEIEEAQR